MNSSQTSETVYEHLQKPMLDLLDQIEHASEDEFALSLLVTYAVSSNASNQLASQISLIEKLRAFMQVIVQEAKATFFLKHFVAEDFVTLFAILLQGKITKKRGDKITQILDTVPEEYLMGEFGYIFTTLKAALDHLATVEVESKEASEVESRASEVESRASEVESREESEEESEEKIVKIKAPTSFKYSDVVTQIEQIDLLSSQPKDLFTIQFGEDHLNISRAIWEKIKADLESQSNFTLLYVQSAVVKATLYTHNSNNFELQPAKNDVEIINGLCEMIKNQGHLFNKKWPQRRSFREWLRLRESVYKVLDAETNISSKMILKQLILKISDKIVTSSGDLNKLKNEQAADELKMHAKQLFSRMPSLSSDDKASQLLSPVHLLPNSQYKEKLSEARALGVDDSVNSVSLFFYEMNAFFNRCQKVVEMMSDAGDEIDLDDYIIKSLTAMNQNQLGLIYAKCQSLQEACVDNESILDPQLKALENIEKLRGYVSYALLKKQKNNNDEVDHMEMVETDSSLLISLNRMNAPEQDKALMEIYLKIQKYLLDDNVKGFALAVIQLEEYCEKITPRPDLNKLAETYALGRLEDPHHLLPILKPQIYSTQILSLGLQVIENMVPIDNVLSSKMERTKKTSEVSNLLYDLERPERQQFENALADLKQYGSKLKEPNARATVATLVRGLREASDDLFIKGSKGVVAFEQRTKMLFEAAYPNMDLPRKWKGETSLGRILANVAAFLKYHIITKHTVPARLRFDQTLTWQNTRTKTSDKAVSLEDTTVKMLNQFKPKGR